MSRNKINNHLIKARRTVQEPCERSRYRNKHRVLDLSFLVDTRLQLQAKFLDIFRSLSILDEVEGEEVGVFCVLKTEKESRYVRDGLILTSF